MGNRNDAPAEPAARNTVPSPAPFWKTPLAELTRDQWEALCDCCGRCCLNKIRDGRTGEFYYTRIACRYLDPETCRCTAYARRSRLVPDCVTLTADNVGDLAWLPPTCAYRLLAEGKELKSWHPLVSGDPESIRTSGISVRGRTVSERTISTSRLEDYRISWTAG